MLLVAATFIVKRYVLDAPSFSRQTNDLLAQESSPLIEPKRQGPVKIESVEFQQLLLNERGEHERSGWAPLHETQYRLRFGDSVQFRAKLSQPAYSFWIAFRPDGVEELCLPTDMKLPPTLTDELVYLPEHYGEAFGLTDAVGLQAFVLVVSKNPLPSYDEWRAKLPDSPWRAEPNAGSMILHHDASTDALRSFDIEPSETTRGGREPLRGQPNALAELVTWIRRSQDSPPLVEAWGLPVLPREDDPK